MQSELRQHLIWAFYVPSLLIAMAYSLLTPVLPVFAGQLTTVYLLIGVILAAGSVGLMIGDLPVSWFLRRFGMKRTMLGGLCLVVVPMLVLIVVHNLWLTLLLLFLAGVGHAFYNISRHAYITATIPLQMRGRAIGLLGGVFRMGNFMGPLLGGWVAGKWGLQYAFAIFVVITLATIFFVWRFMSDAEEDEKEPSLPETKMPLVQMLREQGSMLGIAGSGQVLAQLTRQGWLVLIPLYAANILKLDVQVIGQIVGVGAAVDMIFFYTSGVLMDRFGRKWAIVPSFVMQACGVLVIPFAGSAWALAFISGFIGFANGLSSGTMMTIGSDLAPSHMRGEFLSVWRLIGDAGIVAAPMIVGAVAQALVLQVSVLAIAGSGLGAALIFAAFVPETLVRYKIKPKITPAGD